MEVLHVVPSLDPQHGGPSRSVVQFTDALADQPGCSIKLLTQGLVNGLTFAAIHAGVTRQVCDSQSGMALSLGLPARGGIQQLLATKQVDLIHSHCLWHPVTYWAARAARDKNIPLIIQPRGMLEPWALAQKPLKKRLALKLYQGADLWSARAFVATSAMEADHLRQFGLRQPVAVIPNGVAALPDWTGGTFHTPNQRERVVLFLSRVHPKKGVFELVRAWSQVAPVIPARWRLRIAGPDEGGHWSEVARLVDQLGVGATVDYLGPVEGERKASLYRAADLFVLPTFSENFGLVVAEALAYGVPVITTRGAPWADLETYGCGWWIETGVVPLVKALRQAIALSDEARHVMGEHGRAYVQRYDWDVIAGETLALYRWVLGQGEPPSCVRLDSIS